MKMEVEKKIWGFLLILKTIKREGKDVEGGKYIREIDGRLGVKGIDRKKNMETANGEDREWRKWLDQMTNADVV